MIILRLSAESKILACNKVEFYSLCSITLIRFICHSLAVDSEMHNFVLLHNIF